MAAASLAIVHGARIGQADVFPGHADDAPRQVTRVGAAVEHARQPVERGIRVRAAHRFVQRRNLVVEGIAALVETAQVLRHGFFDKSTVDRDNARRMRRRAHLFQQVEQAPRVAVGQPDQRARGAASSKLRSASACRSARSKSWPSSASSSDFST